MFAYAKHKLQKLFISAFNCLRCNTLNLKFKTQRHKHIRPRMHAHVHTYAHTPTVSLLLNCQSIISVLHSLAEQTTCIHTKNFSATDVSRVLACFLGYNFWKFTNTNWNLLEWSAAIDAAGQITSTRCRTVSQMATSEMKNN